MCVGREEIFPTGEMGKTGLAGYRVKGIASVHRIGQRRRRQGDVEGAFIDSGGGIESGMAERPDEKTALIGFCIRYAVKNPEMHRRQAIGEFARPEYDVIDSQRLSYIGSSRKGKLMSPDSSADR
jgi:hypothetical protein